MPSTRRSSPGQLAGPELNMVIDQVLHHGGRSGIGPRPVGAIHRAAQKIGHLLGALAQQALLAVLIRDEGDKPGAVALAIEVNRWARQLQLVWLESQTSEFLTELSAEAAGLT